MSDERTAIEVSAAISQRISDEIAELIPEAIGHINYEGIRYGALPLFGTIGATWLLRPDGSLWTADSDLGFALEPLPVTMRTMALVAGAERYPWLAELLPDRPAGAEDCRNCGGLGRLAGRAFCWVCGGLGWRPPSTG